MSNNWETKCPYKDCEISINVFNAIYEYKEFEEEVATEEANHEVVCPSCNRLIILKTTITPTFKTELPEEE